ncbi:geranylgeranyl transferase type-2 subunit alpha-like [Saccoglossus kowalevskii]|uniref:Geranylgeranyl transferase type-2 subunit alpha n=1 Tax=Saccoglossus kowalevskii TaxID=10224 RepID=A0ABM0LVW4_SACKO|nr:PREDICTED: geranylgeranyl transferase type-2 subunit alpha-like [Saccoglossus kowalevskii]
MHGRLKVKTTAEQQEAKRKEREKKLQIYNAATKKAFQKRDNKEFDEEALEITGQMLSANSDFTTIWNYRKEVFLDYKKKKTPDELVKIFKSELVFLESCLRYNPKSYGVWHHRCFVMDNMPNPDWKNELKLCNKFLEYDERNFHCWDYRRFVVMRSKVPAEEEIAFTTEKISSNFSNFSSWHYRSKLLPVVHPDPEKKERVREDILHKEYELVQNAFFTDPNDQSAWFYHRWLLGRAEAPQSIRSVLICRSINRIVVCFTKPLDIVQQPLSVSINGNLIKTSWYSASNRDVYSLVWIFQIPDTVLNDDTDAVILISLNNDQISKHCILKKGDTECVIKDNSTPETVFSSDLSAETSAVLQNEFESCQQLQELEPENKWCLLTVVLLMRALDPVKHQEQTLEYIETLKKVDSYRINYYNDLRSKFIIENAIIESLSHDDKIMDLSNKRLSCLYHNDHMVLMTKINLSANQLSSLRHCYMFQCVEILNCDDNNINDLSDVSGLPCLQQLSMQNNCITTIEQLSYLSTCKELTVLNLHGNPVCDIADFKEKIMNMLSNLKTLNGKIQL